MSDTPQTTSKLELNGHANMLRGVAPNKPGPEFEIINLDAGQRVEGIICSPQVWGVHTHWNQARGPKGRSERCTMDTKKSCGGCDRNFPKRWKGYLHFWNWSKKREEFLEITPANFKAMMEQVEPGRALRGLRLRAKRSDGGKQGRLELLIMMYAGELQDLPSPRDPEPFLELLWNWD